jgi:hypothetical protein
MVSLLGLWRNAVMEQNGKGNVSSPQIFCSKFVRVKDVQVYFNKSKFVRNVQLPVKQSQYCSSKNKSPKGVELKRHVFKLLELAPVEDVKKRFKLHNRKKLTTWGECYRKASQF